MHKIAEIFSKSRFLSDHFNDHFVKIFQTKVSDHSATIIFSIILFWKKNWRQKAPSDHFGGRRLYSEFPMKWNSIFEGFVNNFGSNFHFIEFPFSGKVVKCWFPPWKHEVSSKFPFLKVLDFVKILAIFHFIEFPFHREGTVREKKTHT